MCYALTSGRLSPRLALNCTIVDDSHYRDAAGGAGSYTFDGSSGRLDPPTRNAPPNITDAVSGDSCDLQMR